MMVPAVSRESKPFAWHRFTGKERDTESGNDYFGARYYSSAMGRFMSPDDFWNDSHAADPQSWNLYTYGRNNPLRYTDPSGTTATQSWSCSTTDNKTTCNVSITASFAIYAAPGSGITQNQLNSAASTITSSIDKAWTGSFTDANGVNYNVTTSVSVQVVGSQQAAEQSGAQNAIGLSNGAAFPGVKVMGDTVDGSSGVRPGDGSGQDKGTWNINSLGSDAPHEFTHLMGVNDHYELGGTESTGISNLEPGQAVTQDYLWALHGAIQAVDSGVRANTRATEFGHPTTPIGGKSIVGAPTPGNKWW